MVYSVIFILGETPSREHPAGDLVHRVMTPHVPPYKQRTGCPDTSTVPWIAPPPGTGRRAVDLPHLGHRSRRFASGVDGKGKTPVQTSII